MNETSAQVPPQNLEAEESVLGAMMVSQVAITPVVIDVALREGDFYREQHRKIYGVVRALYERSQPVDALTVAEELSKRGELDAVGGRDLVGSLAATAPAPGNARHYAEVVSENAQRRRWIALGQELQQRAGSGGFEGEAGLFALLDEAMGELATGRRSGWANSLDAVEEAVAEAERRARGDTTGMVPTGFAAIDEKIGALRAGRLGIIAGRPGMAKTTLALNIGANVATRGTHVGIFSLEMSKSELAEKLLLADMYAHRGETRGKPIDSDRLAKVRSISEEEIVAQLHPAANRVGSLPLHFNEDANLSIVELRAHAKRLAAEHPLGLLIVDYLQLMEPGRRGGEINRVVEVGEITRSLKVLARELEIPILALSQLSRAVEQRVDKRPKLSDLYESGKIEADADLIFGLYRDEYYDEDTEDPGVCEVIALKARHSSTGTVRLYFDGAHSRFTPLDLAA